MLEDHYRKGGEADPRSALRAQSFIWEARKMREKIFRWTETK